MIAKSIFKQSIGLVAITLILLVLGMLIGVNNSKAEEMSETITIDGSDVDEHNRFKGFGTVSGNNTSRLLLDYKEEHPEKYWEIMNQLFNKETGAGLAHVKVELGGDINSSSGTEPATMRYEDEQCIKRIFSLQQTRNLLIQILQQKSYDGENLVGLGMEWLIKHIKIATSGINKQSMPFMKSMVFVWII